MKVWTSVVVAFIAKFASTAAVNLDRRNHNIGITLTQHDETVVKACLTNTGSTTIRLLNKGTLLDDAPVEKVQVSSATAGPLSFLGIRKRIKTHNLSKDAFTTIEAGKSVDFHVNLAAFHDLSLGGNFHVFTEGTIPFVEVTDSQYNIAKSLSYRSNELHVKVNGTTAARIRRVTASDLHKRTTLDADCTSYQKIDMQVALPECQELAAKAAFSALTASAAKFSEYFRSADSLTRRNVSQRYIAVAGECSSQSSGNTQLHCLDVYQACDGNTLSYTVPVDNLIINCPEYYTKLPVLTNICHGQDMATTTMHEMTHAPGVFFPGTSDFAYGYEGIKQLTRDQAITNADTYALFANAMWMNC